jgi:hypothetical protein
VGEGLGQLLLAEGKLADGPDLGVGLQVLLNLRIKSTSLESNNGRCRIWVVRDRGAALAAEETVDGLARGAGAGPLLDGAVDGELVLGDDGNEGVGASALTLAIVAVVVAGDDGLVDVDRVGDGLAEAVSGECHFQGFGVSI